MNMKSLPFPSMVMSCGNTSNILRITGRVCFEVGLKAKKDVHRRVVSIQLSGVVYSSDKLKISTWTVSSSGKMIEIGVPLP